MERQQRVDRMCGNACIPEKSQFTIISTKYFRDEHFYVYLHINILTTTDNK